MPNFAKPRNLVAEAFYTVKVDAREFYWEKKFPLHERSAAWDYFISVKDYAPHYHVLITFTEEEIIGS